MGVAHAIHNALTLLALSVLGMVVVVAVVDIWLDGRRSSIGQRLGVWSRRYPAFAAGLIFLFGAMLGHFFSQP